MELEKIQFFVYMAASAYHVLSKEVENRILITIAFLDAHLCINNLY